MFGSLGPRRCGGADLAERSYCSFVLPAERKAEQASTGKVTVTPEWESPSRPRPHPGWRFPLSPRGATIVVAVTLSCARNRLQPQGEDWPQDDAAAILEPAAFVPRPAACSRLVAQACSAREVPDTLGLTGEEKVSEPQISRIPNRASPLPPWGVSRCRAVLVAA
jgi:hypothetical protein